MLAPVGDGVHAQCGEGVIEIHIEAGRLAGELGDGSRIVAGGPNR